MMYQTRPVKYYKQVFLRSLYVSVVKLAQTAQKRDRI